MATGKGKGAGAQRLARAEKVAQMRRQQRAQERRQQWLTWGSVVVAVAVIASLTGFSILRDKASKNLDGVRSYKVSAAHVTTPVEYPQDPPAGGEHAPVWLNCATYDEPVPNENAVHSMEHGTVWVTYRPNLPEAQVRALKEQLGDTYEVLSPYPGLSVPVVASAWGKQLRLTGPDDKRLSAVIKAYRLGDQSPESGAPCTGGTDGATPGTGTPMPPGGGS